MAVHAQGNQAEHSVVMGGNDDKQWGLRLKGRKGPFWWAAAESWLNEVCIMTYVLAHAGNTVLYFRHGQIHKS